MGTPEIAVDSLRIIYENNYDIVTVITSPDKPAGRGQKIKLSPVKEFALKHGLKISQPTNLKDPDFIKQLHSLQANLFIVVAFRMLPEIVWTMPEYGTFNLHASLLPQYRGAAPINWAIINGEKETGLTTFFLKHEIDTGDVIYSEKVLIGDDDCFGDLHDKMKGIGADLVFKTIKSIELNNVIITGQNLLGSDKMEIKHAPKLSKENIKINWNLPLKSIHDFIRGLSPYPAAHTNFISPQGEVHYIKIFKSKCENNKHNIAPLELINIDNKILKVALAEGFLVIEELQIAGKKRMKAEDFLRGFQIGENWKVI